MNCHDCKSRKSIPGDCHISCAKAFDSSDPLAALFQILGSVGQMPLPGANKMVNFQPELKHWPGCGEWPSAYDPNIVMKCAGWERDKQPEIVKESAAYIDAELPE